MSTTATFLYEGRIAETGEVFDDGTKESITIAFERGQVMSPVEQALKTMKIGEERVVTVPSQEAYGTYDPKAVLSIPAKDVPDAEHLPVGHFISWRNPHSEKPLPVRVAAMENGVVTFDFNHPLIDTDLSYWIKLVSRS